MTFIPFLRLGQLCFIVVPVITQYKIVSHFKQKYSPDEIDATYALLALSSSAPAPPPCYKTVTVRPGANASSTATDDKQRPCASQTTHQPTPQIHSCQVSLLAELNSFVAVALPIEDEKCPLKNERHSTSLPVSLLFVFTKPAYTVFRASRSVSKQKGKIRTFN